MQFEVEQKLLLDLARKHSTPLFVYSQKMLEDRAQQLLDLDAPFGYTPRYAVKANNHPDIIRLLHRAGLQFDASSSYEATELLDIGIQGDKISLSSQQPAHNLPELLNEGVRYVATSLHQLGLFCEQAGGQAVGLRVNPGLGAGHNNRTTTGGANSSFGLWADYVPQALELVAEHNVKITILHVHIGSGADPNLWGKVMDTCLEIVSNMPDVTTLDIGGGFKIHRYGDEQEAQMPMIFKFFTEKLAKYADETGRKLHLEVEPGTWLAGHAGVLLAEVVDMVDTGPDGHRFLRLNTGMNDILRPSMYGAQHVIEALTDTQMTKEYVVVGHNCETGDILTPASGDPEGIEPRTMREANIGDVVAIYDTGAYCRSMSAKGYNSYPNANEVLV